MRCVVDESLDAAGDVDSAISAWLNYLQNVPGKLSLSLSFSLSPF